MKLWRFPNDVQGWLTELEGTGLAALATGKKVLEIGSYLGRSTICMAQTAWRVTAVDTFDGQGTPTPLQTLERFSVNLKRFQVEDRVHVAVGPSTTIIPTFLHDSFDIVFIDGAHDTQSVLNDVGASMRVVKSQGLFVFHDYRTFPGEYDGRWDPGVTEVVNGLVSGAGKMILLARFGTVAVLKRNLQ